MAEDEVRLTSSAPHDEAGAASAGTARLVLFKPAEKKAAVASAYPPVLANIISVEIMERFCFYGTRTRLTAYLTGQLHVEPAVAVSIYSFYTALCYITPLVGGYIADVYLGRFKTIALFIIVYLIGVFTLALTAFSASIPGFAIGLLFMGVGSGGIKPCISIFGAEQIDASDTKRVRTYFNIFYFSINVGSTIAYIVPPAVRDKQGYGLAFLIPALMLSLAYFIFLLPFIVQHIRCCGGLRRCMTYRIVQPSGVSPWGSVIRVLYAAWQVRRAQRLRGVHDVDAHDDDATNSLLLSPDGTQVSTDPLPTVDVESGGGGVSSSGTSLQAPPVHYGTLSATSGASKTGSASASSEIIATPLIRAGGVHARAPPVRLRADAGAQAQSAAADSGSTRSGCCSRQRRVAAPPRCSCINIARARGGFSETMLRDVRTLLGLLPIFSLLPMFWAIFDSQGSVWLLQRESMRNCLGTFCFAPEVPSTLGPILVLVMVPLFDRVLFPGLERLAVACRAPWLAPTPLRRISVGMFVAASAFGMTAFVQHLVDTTERGHLSVVWQFPQFILVTTAEILVSVTALEFSFSQAPTSMRGSINAFYLLSVSIGNMLTGAIYGGLKSIMSPLSLIFLIMGLMIASGCVFILVATWYRPQPPALDEKEAASSHHGQDASATDAASSLEEPTIHVPRLDSPLDKDVGAVTLAADDPGAAPQAPKSR